MPMLASMPTVRRLETDRSDLAAFDIVGMISSADLENLYGLLEAAYLLHPQIDLLLRVTDCEGVDLADAAGDTMSEGKEHAGEHIGRCAIVGDSTGIAAASRLFVTGRSVDVKEFKPDDEDAAWDWLGARKT